MATIIIIIVMSVQDLGFLRLAGPERGARTRCPTTSTRGRHMEVFQDWRSAEQPCRNPRTDKMTSHGKEELRLQPDSQELRTKSHWNKT